MKYLESSSSFNGYSKRLHIVMKNNCEIATLMIEITCYDVIHIALELLEDNNLEQLC